MSDRCPKHKRYMGKAPPKRKCRHCWELYYAVNNIPYNPETLRSLRKVHTVYRQKSGQKVAGVTTIISKFNGDTGALIHWAWKCGLNGEDYRKVRDQAADIGTVAHEMVRAHLLDIEADWSKIYGGEIIEKAEHAFYGFLDWEKENDVKPILIEESLTSEKMPFGGTIDLYAEVNGKKSLVDFKTGKGIYPPHRVQVAAYKMLLEEYGHKVDSAKILHFKRPNDEDDLEPEFHVYNLDNIVKETEIFKVFAKNYKLWMKVFKGW